MTTSVLLTHAVRPSPASLSRPERFATVLRRSADREVVL